jgi:hypothetical protein
MDFLHFNETYSVLICTRCQYAVVSTLIAAHLRDHHRPELSKKDIDSCARFFKPLLPPEQVQRIQVPVYNSTDPLPRDILQWDQLPPLCRAAIYLSA